MSTNGLSKQPITVINPPPMPTFQASHKPIAVSPGNPPWSETVVVTPELAEQWLGANTRNRKVRKSRVKQYARDMARGAWQFNTQGITFATDGSLIDGQHRLKAVVMADVSVAMVVWFNVPPATRSVIDLVGPRNLADIAELSNIQAAVAQAMMRGLGGRGTETMAERKEFYLRFAEQIDGAICRFPTHIRGVTQANVLAAIARASLHLNAQDIEQFCEVLRTGMHTDNPRDATVIKLRDRLLQGGHAGGGSKSAKDVYSISVAALRAFGEGRALTKLYATTVEPFPLPKIETE